MSVCAYTEKLDIYSAGGFYRRIEIGAFFCGIFRVAVEDVNIRFVNINAVEKIFVHKSVVAVLVITRKIDIFIKVEGRGVLEAYNARVIASYKLFISGNGRRACRKTEDTIFFRCEQGGEFVRAYRGDFPGIIKNFYFHNNASNKNSRYFKLLVIITRKCCRVNKTEGVFFCRSGDIFKQILIFL